MLAMATTLMTAADSIPEATISNGPLKVRFHLPDAVNGYYRGTRFDWAGVIPSLEFKGHNYFGVWFDKYDPKLHDAITGPVEEFYFKDSALGYAEAKPGETFVRLGVGVLRKADDAKFDRFHTYDIVDGGKWTVKRHKDFIEFHQKLTDKAAPGYGYDYQKTVRLISGKPEMAIEHVLKNTGKKTIETDVYNHNFFVIDGQQTGPDLAVTFPFDPKSLRDMGELAELRGREIAYKRIVGPTEHVMTEIAGYGEGTADHSFKVENRKTGAGVRVSGDHPMTKLLFWCGWKVLSPENYVTMKIEPGQEFKWSVRYEFYTLAGK